MPTIQVQAVIQAPTERVFDLCRNVEVHVISTAQTHEKAVAGVTTGLLGLDDVVTWEATHLGVRQQLTSCITQFEPPFFFQDKMVCGAFEAFTHDHNFYTRGKNTVVEDRFIFISPFGLIGTIFNQLFLTEYMRNFLNQRLQVIRNISESSEWEKYL
ncbi:hypothetical protein C1752_15933 [Acaryochloris thomasi RCC1774]|uniref:Coenzyme Q-binding protein COQ10 START domain-containing protein n=1 Tax=Acaryochloris thomasi RCC1774 TaxID=1764569 RepID=A0A2W1JLS9_9CYAN|nr:SRPBCC family protein [Acaryochloris thomasi]PZD70241.1 hypothetical protein C1752_15933 [Acaryochloris thomasi RCC1774]